LPVCGQEVSLKFELKPNREGEEVRTVKTTNSLSVLDSTPIMKVRESLSFSFSFPLTLPFVATEGRKASSPLIDNTPRSRCLTQISRWLVSISCRNLGFRGDTVIGISRLARRRMARASTREANKFVSLDVNSADLKVHKDIRTIQRLGFGQQQKQLTNRLRVYVHFLAPVSGPYSSLDQS